VETMMALRAHSRGGPEQLVFEQAPKPTPSEGEALVRVHAAAITFAELDWDLTWAGKDGADRTPIIPAHEVSGVVETPASSGSFLEAGDEVFGLIGFDHDGAAAQYACVPEEGLTRKPCKATHEQAAAVALSGLTAWQALMDQAELQPHERVLITGATGGVGGYAVQIARVHGAQVTAIGDEAGREQITRLGAAQYLDQGSDPVANLSGFDVMLDAAGAGDDEASYDALSPGGRMILLAAPPDLERANEHHVDARSFVVCRNARELGVLCSYVDKGILEPMVSQAFPLSEGRAAYESKSTPRPPGKTVLLVP
jgi:NADPH:quinone reductase-like Zn-dependent oxidoreductase